jgi:hypothetical protein
VATRPAPEPVATRPALAPAAPERPRAVSWVAPSSPPDTVTELPRERRRFPRWLIVVLSGFTLTVGGVSLVPLVGDDSRPSAPFGRSSPPSQQSGAGLALASPFGYSWSDDGALTVEMWAYNADRLPQIAECDVAISSKGRLVAQGTFSSDGVLPPRLARVTTVTFPRDQAPGRFASLNQSESEVSCRSRSV